MGAAKADQPDTVGADGEDEAEALAIDAAKSAVAVFTIGHPPILDHGSGGEVESQCVRKAQAVLGLVRGVLGWVKLDIDKVYIRM